MPPPLELPPERLDALYQAIERNTTDEAAQLLEEIRNSPLAQGPELEYIARPLLIQMVHDLNPRAVAFALSQGADPNIQDQSGRTALHYLTKEDLDRPLIRPDDFWQRYNDTVDILLQCPTIDVTRADPLGRTPLHTAAAMGAETLLRKLIQRLPKTEDGKYNANLYAQDRATPLHFAALHGRETTVACLTAPEVEIDVNTVSAEQTALNYAIIQALRSIQAREYEKTNPEQCRVIQKHYKLVTDLISRGACLDTAAANSLTPYEEALKYRLYHVIKAFIIKTRPEAGYEIPLPQPLERKLKEQGFKEEDLQELRCALEIMLCIKETNLHQAIETRYNQPTGKIYPKLLEAMLAPLPERLKVHSHEEQLALKYIAISPELKEKMPTEAPRVIGYRLPTQSELTLPPPRPKLGPTTEARAAITAAGKNPV